MKRIKVSALTADRKNGVSIAFDCHTSKEYIEKALSVVIMFLDMGYPAQGAMFENSKGFKCTLIEVMHAYETLYKEMKLGER